MDSLTTILEQTLQETPMEGLPAFLGQLATIQARAQLRLLHGPTATKPKDSGSRLLTIEHVAEQLSVKASYVYELAKTGKLGSVRMGKYVRIPEQALAQYQKTLK